MVFHAFAAFALIAISLGIGFWVLVRAKEQEGSGLKGFGTFLGYFIVALSFLFLLSVGYTSIRYWEDGYFARPSFQTALVGPTGMHGGGYGMMGSMGMHGGGQGMMMGGMRGGGSGMMMGNKGDCPRYSGSTKGGRMGGNMGGMMERNQERMMEMGERPLEENSGDERK
ncbi:MAG: hypothetical protein ACE5GH_02570 [Fidelibacterota bacterium]